VVTSRQRTLLGSPHNDNNAIKANGLTRTVHAVHSTLQN
jgi:hypothetical protein